MAQRKRSLTEIESILGRPCTHAVRFVGGRSVGRSRWGDYCRPCAQIVARRELEQRQGLRLSWKPRPRKPTDEVR
jgi:hypothetical protein